MNTNNNIPPGTWIKISKGYADIYQEHCIGLVLNKENYVWFPTQFYENRNVKQTNLHDNYLQSAWWIPNKRMQALTFDELTTLMNIPQH